MGFFSCLVGDGVDSRLCEAGDGVVDCWDCCEATGEAWALWITTGLDVMTSDLTVGVWGVTGAGSRDSEAMAVSDFSEAVEEVEETGSEGSVAHLDDMMIININYTENDGLFILTYIESTKDLSVIRSDTV